VSDDGHYLKARDSEERARDPYAGHGIVEPFESWFNVDRVRLDYYNGMDTYIFRSDINTTWQVNPGIDTPMCFTTAGSVDLYNYYPDTTGFVLQGDTVQVLDVSPSPPEPMPFPGAFDPPSTSCGGLRSAAARWRMVCSF
jgi:hypothetical protein